MHSKRPQISQVVSRSGTMRKLILHLLPLVHTTFCRFLFIGSSAPESYPEIESLNF